MLKRFLCVATVIVALFTAIDLTVSADELPAVAKGGVTGEPISLLVISSESNKVALIDPAYQAELKAAGYRVTVVNHEQRLGAEYLRQFGVVVLANLPFAGEEYAVYGYRNRYVGENLALLQDYVAAGGGLVLMPAISEFGEAYGRTYGEFLKPYGASFLIQQLKDGHSAQNEMGTGTYGVGQITGGHPISAGLEGQPVLYPMNVMRWDHAYSCTPVLTDANWQVLAAADGAHTYMALSNNAVGDPMTDENTLFAVREAGKGHLAVSAIHSYYTLTMVSSKEDHVGENGTGVIDFIVMRGEQDGRASAYGKLLDRSFRVFAAGSAAQGIGAWRDIEPPAMEPYPESTAAIDWETQTLPPTWAHRVIPSDGWPKTYDELPDPTIKGEMKYWKMLIGARTAYSSGEGTVAEYRAAAIAAGYSAIAFAETLEDLTPEKWAKLLRDCEANSDASFICLPGMNLQSIEGQRYLVLGADRYPAPEWLTEDGKQLEAIRMLSLGWFGHVTVVHKPGSGALHPKTFKHYTGIGVATYDSAGKQIDDGMYAYHWAQSVDSGAVPIAVHEVLRPADVQAATTGFQQILPAPTLAGGVKYFCFGFAHNFDAPMRYFISEGPILDGWSLFNKDKGKPEENRTQFRMQVGVRSDDGATPITSVKLYDEFNMVRHWRPDAAAFSTIVDGSHNKQHCFLLLAEDARGRRVLSPLLRTVSRNWRLRCGDKQNWLGSQLIYTGWWLNGLPGYNLKLPDTKEGDADNGAPILDFPFFSDHAQVNVADMGYHFARGERKDIAGDGKGMLPMAENEWVKGAIRYTYFSDLKDKKFSVMLVDMTFTLLKDAELSPGALNPQIGNSGTLRWNNALILPDGKVDTLGKVIDHTTKKTVAGNPANATLSLPVGAYVGGIVPLTPGLQIDGRQLGLKAEPGVQPAGTTWNVRFLMLRGRANTWKTNRMRGFNQEIIDDKAEQALAEMGFRGTQPYTLKLTQGSLDATAYFAHLSATNGGVAGSNTNTTGTPMQMYVPMLIKGLDADSEMVLWRSDSPYLESFAAFEGEGYLSFDADKTVDFYAGNAAICDPALAVSIVKWNADEAHFRVHNPTDKAITSPFQTASAIRGFKPVTTTIVVPAGTSIDVQP